MKIEVLTLFPEIYDTLNVSVIGRALKNGVFEVGVHNIRDYSSDKHKRCDDYPYGGGAGMVMTPQPLHDAITAVDPDRKFLRIYLSPKGKKLEQSVVTELASAENIMLINGSYEGIDQRIIDLDVDMELSIGDYVLTSGDLASLVVINAVARYIPDVLGSEASTDEESFSQGYLEYPHYTRPPEFMGLSVPPVLLSGNHAEIAKWRKNQSEIITKEKRPDLL
ncbi:MAG: tRNA (guanosine(37)-N1)-methyltransferase TrmD [Clostridiales bacterium]|nr:tRNA (guanosine(37)-N1)-methyltransferase TrmD [Clostridiales bacterium]MDY4655780.1 tRNA (guanosine(37)-N1)-methyltransferase TrmD [Eubacteriales bacterium]